MPVGRVAGNMNKKQRYMKRLQTIFYGTLLFIGFIMLFNESMNPTPNALGVILFALSAYKLKLFHFQRNER